MGRGPFKSMTTWKSAESPGLRPRNNGQPKRIVLEQSGWDDDGNPHEIDTPNKHLIRVTALENDPRRRVTRFSVEAVPGNGIAEMFARARRARRTASRKGSRASIPATERRNRTPRDPRYPRLGRGALPRGMTWPRRGAISPATFAVSIWTATAA